MTSKQGMSVLRKAAPALSPATLEAVRKRETERGKRLVVHFWQTSTKQGVRKARDEAAMKGMRVPQSGVIGAANFPVVDASLEAMGGCQVVASTNPLTLTDVPWGGGGNLNVPYRLLLEIGEVRVFVSTNVEEDPDITEVIGSAVASVVTIQQMRTFSGDILFLTFNAMGQWTLSGPSCGAAVFAAVNGYFPSVYLTGSVVIEEGLLKLKPVLGLEQKLSMTLSDGSVLAGPVEQSEYARLDALTAQAGTHYISPAQAAFGVISSPDNRRVGFIGLGDIGSLATVCRISETAGEQVRVVSENVVRPAVQRKVDPSDVDMLNPAVYRYRGLTPEKLRAMIEKANNNAAGWTNSLSDAWDEFTATQAFIDQVEEMGILEEAERASQAIGVKEDRWDAALRQGGKSPEDQAIALKRLQDWITAAGKLVKQPQSESKKAAQKAKMKAKKAENAPKLPQAKRAPAKLVNWEDIE